MKHWLRYLSLLLCCTACSLFKPSGDHFGAFPVTYDQLSGWHDDNAAQALAVFNASCPMMAAGQRSRTSGSNIQIPRSVWQSLCTEAAQVPADNEQARAFFERRFIPYRITNNDEEKGLFTGYYEPVLFGSHRKHGAFVYPLYLPPHDLKSRKPYYTHAQIDRGVLRNRGLELVWVKDPVMLFFLQIQGSGIILFNDNTQLLVGYADQNGQPYESLGKIMGDEGLIPKDQINFFTLRQWLYDHPKQAMAMMERNPSYVFFRPLEAVGPIGAAGAVLTPQRSIAVDNHYIPYGLPLFMETRLPATPDAPDRPFHQLMVAQDTGGAIRGPVRADIFFGPGMNAEYLAGYMKGHGIYSLLVPKEIANQL